MVQRSCMRSRIACWPAAGEVLGRLEVGCCEGAGRSDGAALGHGDASHEDREGDEEDHGSGCLLMRSVFGSVGESNS